MKNETISEVIDFQARFMQDFIAWSEKHPETAKDEDKLEIAAERARVKWYAAKKSWLNGISPNEYFESIEDAASCVSMFISYIEQEIALPEPLIDRLIVKKQEAYPLLTSILNIDEQEGLDKEALNEVRAGIIALIEEMQLAHPFKRYAEIMLTLEEQQPLSEAIMFAFEGAEDKESLRELLLNTYPLTEGYNRIMALDVLTSVPDTDGQVTDIVLSELKNDELELAQIADYCAQLMDERALPYLKEYLEDCSDDYYTFTRLRYAIEAISGEIIEEKDFTGDLDYERLAALDEEDIFG